jgi:hypothetical protein
MIAFLIFAFLVLSLALFAVLLYFAAKHVQTGIQSHVRAKVRAMRKQMNAVQGDNANLRTELAQVQKFVEARLAQVEMEVKKHGLKPMPPVSSLFKGLEDRHEKEVALNTVVSVNDKPVPVGQ